MFGTVFGLATSLGLGVSQMATGFNVLFGIDPGIVTQLVLIAVISVIATVSAVSGVGNGIHISEWNIWLSIVLLAAFFALGPFKWLKSLFITSLGSHVWNLFPDGKLGRSERSIKANRSRGSSSASWREPSICKRIVYRDLIPEPHHPQLAAPEFRDRRVEPCAARDTAGWHRSPPRYRSA